LKLFIHLDILPISRTSCFHSPLISHFIQDKTRQRDSDDVMSPNCVQYTSRSPHSSHFKDFLLPLPVDITLHTRQDTAILTTPCPRTVYSIPADPLLPQQIHHAHKHTTPAVTMSCINALLLLETSNYASTANLRSFVSAHIVVSSKQQLKTVTWLPLVLPIVTCTCFLSQPWTVTTAKLQLQVSVFDGEHLTTVLYSFARNGGIIHSIET
jgi:hypothetical protein